ncbi:MAG: LutB/LldF family L-lactate oxidation iron-sulfur protein [Desulfomonilaceae bacterium]|nr:LutB/LldF family L-lactate oxidation iron-sulfur protein [Desulfomonilaceae bacterium]
MSTHAVGIDFRSNAKKALGDASLRASMRHAAETFASKRTGAFASVPVEDWRDRASEIRLNVLDNLPDYLDRFTAAATRAGAVVHRAKDAAAARETVAYLLKDRRVDKVVKSKSMVTEEIHLNDHLEMRGIEVVETDLGEYIIQIAGEAPSHIIVPAIHKNRRQVGKVFSEKLGVEYTDDPVVLTSIARKILRKEFLSAQAGISGANFAVAESGSLVLFTNEGNGRMVTTLPPLHIAVLSIEKIIPKLSDLAALVRLLPRSATGQTLTSYLSIITGTRRPHERTGSKELHIVLVDNGRSQILAGECRDMLKCIRCSACLNVCPVYRTVGGHAYGSTYPGPMGIILTTLLDGMNRAHPLLDATTLCGACNQVCPVKVPLVRLLRILREQRVEAGFTSPWERTAMAAFGFAAKSPTLFTAGQRLWKTFLPVLGIMERSGTVGRLPKPAGKTFRRRMS